MVSVLSSPTLSGGSKPQNIAEATGRRAKEVHALLTCSEEEYSKALCVVRRTVAGDFLISGDNPERLVWFGSKCSATSPSDSGGTSTEGPFLFCFPLFVSWVP